MNIASIFYRKEISVMAISSITERFYLDEKGYDRFIEIMKKTENRPVKQIQMTNKYEEGKKLLKKFFCR